MVSHDSARGPNGLPLNRREVLTLTGAASAVATTQAFANEASAAAEHPPNIVMADALPLADTIRSRQVSRVEVMKDYLDHIEKINPKVNAIVALQDRASLLAQASERDGISGPSLTLAVVALHSARFPSMPRDSTSGISTSSRLPATSLVRAIRTMAGAS